MKEHTELPHYSITYCCSSDIKSSEGNTITKVTHKDFKEPNIESIKVTTFIINHLYLRKLVSLCDLRSYVRICHSTKCR